MKDGLQGITHDRVLMRLINYMQIVGWVAGFFWGSIQIVRYLDRINTQIVIMQQQMSALQHIVTSQYSPIKERNANER